MKLAGPTDMRPYFALVLIASTACAANARDVAPPLSTTAAATNMHTAINPGATFDSYRTFSFGAPQGAPLGYAMTPRSAEVQRRLPSFITAALARKGYVAVAGKGDIVILFGAGLRDRSIREPSDVGAAWLPDDEDADFVEGSLVIDAFDGVNGHMVWHGASQGEVNPDGIVDEALERAVLHLLSSFPRAGDAQATP